MSNTLNNELKTLAAGLSARGYNNLSSEILKLSAQEVTHGRNAAAQVSRVLVSKNNLDAGWTSFLESKAAAGKLDWEKILGWIAIGIIWKSVGGWRQGGFTFPGTYEGLARAGMAWSGSQEGHRVRETGGGFLLEQSDDPKPIFDYINALPGIEMVDSYQQAQQLVNTSGVNEGMLRVDIQGRQQAQVLRPERTEGREEQEPVARQDGGQGETGEGRGSSGEGTEEGRVSWAAVQRKLTQMGGTRQDGEPLRIDGIWGNNTAHAWGQVTDGAERPSNPDSAMEALEAIEEREQRSAARQEEVDRRLLVAYVMYDEDRLNLTNRDDILATTGMSVAGNFEDAQDLVDDLDQRLVTQLYNTDKIAYGEEEGNDERNFEIILRGFLRRKLDADQRPTETQEQPEISLREYYNPSGTNIFMRKSDGALFYGMRDGNRDTLFPLENRTQTRGGGPDYLSLREQRKMLREVRREHDRGTDTYRAYKDIIQGQRRFETGERNIFQPRGRAERGGAQRQRGRETLERTRGGGENLTRRQRRQQRRQERQERRRG